MKIGDRLLYKFKQLVKDFSDVADFLVVYIAEAHSRGTSEPSARQDQPEPSARQEPLEPSARQDQPEPSARQDQPEPSARQDQPEPSASHEQPDPSASHEQPDPSASHEQPDPSASHEQPDPSASHEQPDPSASHEQPDPSASHEQPDPSASHEQPDPSASHEQPDPSASHEQPDPSQPGLAERFPCGLVHQMLQDFLLSWLEAVGYSALCCGGLVKALSEDGVSCPLQAGVYCDPGPAGSRGSREMEEGWYWLVWDLDTDTCFPTLTGAERCSVPPICLLCAVR
ncbi:unnamed protein product [Coregonus sp. 'balchen']|nr:unnamed protein product [Coregonus sp. 'balchen']